MSTSELLNSLFKFRGGVLPKRNKSASKKGVNKVLNNVYRANVPRMANVKRNRLHKKQPVLFERPGLDDDFMAAFSSMGLSHKRSHKKKNSVGSDMAMMDAPRRSGRNRSQTDRWSPTAAAKKDKENAKKSKQTSKQTSKKRRSSSPKKSRSSSPDLLDFMKMKLF